MPPIQGMGIETNFCLNCLALELWKILYYLDNKYLFPSPRPSTAIGGVFFGF